MGFVNDLYFLAHNFRKNIDIVLWGLDCVGFCWVRWNYQFWFVMLWLPMYLGWFSAYLNFNFFYYITLSIYKSRIVCVSYSLFYFLRKNWMCHIVIGGGKIGSLKAFGFMVCKSQSLHMVFWPRLPCLFNPFGWKKTWWNRTLHMVYIYIYIHTMGATLPHPSVDESWHLIWTSVLNTQSFQSLSDYLI